MRSAIVLALFAFAIASGAALADVPSRVSFSARLVNEDTGEVVTGAHRLKFELFDAATGGKSVWLEGRQFEIDEDGLLFAELGETKALDAAVFDGKQLWLEVSLDEQVMEPRIAIASVPYAVRAHAAADADKVGGKSPSDFQSRVTGTCNTGSFVTTINADGTVNCAAGATGTGDITEVVAGSGLQGGGAAGSVTLGLLQSCAANQILKWTGAAWTCQADAVGTGDISGVAVGPGLTGGGTSGDVTVSLMPCATGQLLKWNGSTWVCAADIDTDTNSGGDITSITTPATSGLVGGVAAGDATLSLLTTCGTNQILKWSGAAWACANDNDTDTNSGGDITDVVAGAGLSGGGANGAVTLDVGGGTGITVNANNVTLDTVFTDGRYVNTTGDSMSGSLNMGNNTITNRGCPAEFVKIGTSLCTEDNDAEGTYTFTGCATKCRGMGGHVCSSAEFRAIMTSGVTLATTTALDWMDDQDGDDSAVYINNSASPENPDGTRATSTVSYCRCCTDVE